MIGERRSALSKSLSCPVLHLTPISHQASCHTGTSRTRRKSFLNCKLGVIWEFGGDCNVGPTISCWTNRPALSLAAHEGKKNTDGRQSTVLTSTLAVLVLTLKVCYDSKKTSTISTSHSFAQATTVRLTVAITILLQYCGSINWITSHYMKRLQAGMCQWTDGLNSKHGKRARTFLWISLPPQTYQTLEALKVL